MSKKISGAEYPLAKIFSSDFQYVIPSYQRPYTWEEQHASVLFDDLYNFFQTEKEDEYFLGSIVLIKQEGKPFAEVIDGQQRLTTLTILFAVFAALDQGGINSQLYKYIFEPGNEFEGINPQPRLTLRERDKDYFKKYVQELNFEALFKLDNEQLENEAKLHIKQNSKVLYDKVKTTFDHDAQGLKEFIKFLVQ